MDTPAGPEDGEGEKRESEYIQKESSAASTAEVGWHWTHTHVVNSTNTQNVIKDQKRSSVRIPTWSPTVVLTDPEDA